MSSPVTIYALKCPDTLKIRYVGKTILSPEARLAQHFCDPSVNRRTRWLRKLAQGGKRPVIEVLEVVEEHHWQDRERFWIAKLRADGCDLVNLTDGGEGASRKLPEDLFRKKALCFPPDLWAEVEELIPPRERSAVAAEAFRREVKRRRRAARDHPPG
jgi:hypothetical protein